MPLYLLFVPALIEALPLVPCSLFFFSTILIIPLMPSGSYFAEGLVITSTDSMALAGMPESTPALPAPLIPLGLPSIKMVTFPLPRKLILPSISTLTVGTCANTSLAEPPFAIDSFSALNTFLSMVFFTMSCWASMVTSFSTFSLLFNKNLPKSLSSILRSNNVSIVKVL